MRAGEDSASAVADGPLAAGWRWLWQAPEVAAVLGKHVEAAAADDAQVLSATALSIIAAGQLGRGLAVVDDALAALDAAEAGEHLEIGWLLRLELAGAAKALRLPRIGMRALADVLTSATRPSIVGAALVRGHSLLAGRCGHRSELAEVLAIAEKCYRGDDRVDDDVAALLRAAVRVEMARWHRRVGELGAAISAAGEGLGLLSTLRHADLDSGKI
ncbi:MAG: hypothetical protein J2O49_03780, partial [Sciscionella sp.]|nr:hypothetical protein [Sciscionella sp.]